ncbi:alpha/beta hydrolase [Kitasatospora viridis]|uniref:Alpha/beta hydrolase family protein n=1 Tax=Kitasatospora viridis TaxID=281105 RepID=A0A561SE19_9ACTN|nr:alpha/beta hydrolase [Kitasatospora viridis]TWF73112.1 alpha/beta hydrolase family protein [Kitasatospora viridis]
MSPNDATVLLVHGAWADGSSWRKVIGPLRGAGVRVLAAQLPLTSPAEDLAALERTLGRVEGPVVLVGHAYAGAVIAQVEDPRVRALVYVAALAPDEGETVAAVFGRAAPHPAAPALEPGPDGLIWLPEPAFAAAFAPGATAAEQGVLAAVQRPIALSCITTEVGRPRWRDLPSWFLVAERDRMIAPATQRFMADRMAARQVSAQVDHMPLLTAPGVVAEVVLEVVRSS